MNHDNPFLAMCAAIDAEGKRGPTPAARLYVGVGRRTIWRNPRTARKKDIGRPILAKQVLATDAGVLISANSMWDVRASKKGRRGFRAGIREARFQRATLGMDFALDSAGFTAMKAKPSGYRWKVPDYVEMALHAGRWASGGEWADPAWAWWAQMDYCVEKEVARTRGEVIRRIHMTAEALEEAYAEVDRWKREAKGTSYEDTVYTDPMPVLQGWDADDYLLSIDLLDAVLQRSGREWPTKVGLGSVCRRHARGPSGLWTVVPAVARELPPHVGMHLFGIKGGAIARLCELAEGQITSVDSMAWDLGVRRFVQKQIKSVPCPDCRARVGKPCDVTRSFWGSSEGRKKGFCPDRKWVAREAGLQVSSSLELKSRHLDSWIKKQLKALGRGNRPGLRGRYRRRRRR